MQVIPVTAVHRGFGTTSRRDNWWAAPLGVFLGLSAFIVYATWAAFQGDHYHFGPYLSPFYSPELWGELSARVVRPEAGMVAGLLPFSPALLILPFPGGFRFHLLLLSRRLLQVVLGGSAVMRRRRTAQELSRRELVPADPAEHAPLFHVGRRSCSSCCWRTTCGWRSGSRIPATGPTEFGIGVGTIVLARQRRAAGQLHAGAATSLRHVVGGRMDEVSKSPVCDMATRASSGLNSAPPVVRVVQPVLGDVRRRLRPPLLDGDLDDSGSLMVRDLESRPDASLSRPL